MTLQKWMWCAALCACASAGYAQQPAPARVQPAQASDSAKYPVKPIRVVIGFAPGGAVDVPARIIAQRMSESLGQPLIVENRPGADGIVAGDYVAKSAPDGYTLLYVSAGHAMNSILHAKTLPYHPINDFSPISIVAAGPLTLVVNPVLPARSLKELVALARAQPGKLNFASSGSGGTMHLAGELLKSMAHVDIVHVPFKGGAPAVTSVMAGQVELTFVGAPAAMPHIRSGKLRVLAVTSARRAAALPEVPTVAELGYPGYEVAAWYGVLGPARTPAPIVAQLSSEIAKAVGAADIRERLLTLGIEGVGSSPEQFTELLKREIARWTPIIRNAGIKPD